MSTPLFVRTIATTSFGRKRALAHVSMPWRNVTAVCSIMFILTQALFVPPVQADTATVVINELMWMGSSSSSADEWIELGNVTPSPIDISNWQLTKKSNGVEVPMLTLPIGSVIQGNSYYLISNYSSTSTSSDLGVAPDFVTTDVALSNSALQIRLYDSSHGVIDIADDGVGNPLAGQLDSTNHRYAAMERNPEPGDGTLAQNWHTASQSSGFKTSAPDFGTPKTHNSNGVPVSVAGPDQIGVVGEMVNFDGSDSSDPELQPLTFDWDFGDGEHASVATPQHMYSSAGKYQVILTVSDGIDSARDQLEVVVTEPAVSTTKLPSVPIIPSASTCRGLRLSEIFPNPAGVDTNEFIELENAGDDEITIHQCVVALSDTKKYVLQDTTVRVGGFILLNKAETKLTLTNASGALRLLDTDGTELDRITYDEAKEGASFALINGKWQWTKHPTPGNKNEYVSITNAATKKTSSVSKKSQSKKSSKPKAQNVSLSAIQGLDSGDRVIISGQVTSLVGSLGSTLTTIQSNDGAVTLTVPNGTGPFEMGQTVQVTGTVRLYQGRRRVAVDTGSVKSIPSSTNVDALSVATDDVGQDQADGLVHVKGVIALASGNHIDIDDGSGPVSIYIKSSTGIVRPKVKMGDTLDVVGIVGVSSSGVRIFPRSQNDLHVERVLGASTSSTTLPTTNIPTSSTKQTAWYWAFVGLGALGAAIRPALKAWKKRETA